MASASGRMGLVGSIFGQGWFADEGQRGGVGAGLVSKRWGVAHGTMRVGVRAVAESWVRSVGNSLRLGLGTAFSWSCVSRGRERGALCSGWEAGRCFL